MSGRGIVLILTLAALSACGSRQTLHPPEGQAPPAIPRGASEPLTAQQLMDISTQARPERNAELLRRSEERQDDPFDLPPEKK